MSDIKATRYPRRPVLLQDLPLFASDAELSAAVLGPGRVVEFRKMLPLLERRGFPRIDAVMGGRYTPGVRAYFDEQYGLIREKPRAPQAPEGIENLNDDWKRKPGRKPVPKPE